MIKAYYDKDEQGFTYVFPVDQLDTLYVGCPGSDWRKLVVGDYTFDCGILTQAMYDRLRNTATMMIGSFNIES